MALFCFILALLSHSRPNKVSYSPLLMLSQKAELGISNLQLCFYCVFLYINQSFKKISERFSQFSHQRVCTKSLCCRGPDKKSQKERKCMDRETLGREGWGRIINVQSKKFSDGKTVQFGAQ